MKYRTNCPHNDMGFCANCRDEGFILLGLSKAQENLSESMDQLFDKVTLDKLREIKKQAIAVISYTERYMFLEERKIR